MIPSFRLPAVSTATFILLSLCAVFLFASLAKVCAGTEYFVSKQGDDASDGLSPASALATIQKGVDALEPGDVLTIGPGEYFESVSRDGLGSPEAQTIIRAAIPGTVILRGDIGAPDFVKDEEFRFAYTALFPNSPLAVLEHDTLQLLHSVPKLGEVDYAPGSFHYDEESQRLHISPSDLRGPEGRNFTIAVQPGSGLYLGKPVRVVVEGLVFTGFGARPTGHGWTRNRSWGIALDQPTDCEIRNVTAFLNYGGIGIENGSGNVVDACLAFGNLAHNILFRGGPENRDNVIENSRAYRSASGMHFYGRIAGPVTLRNNIAWGHDLDFSNKSGSDTAREFGRVENCVGLGDFQAQGLEHTLMGGVNEYDRRLEAPQNNILFRREADLDLEVEFADPENLDFRLQAGSRFRGADGEPDRGPFPFQADVFFLSPTGSDENDGLSVDSAWKTLAAAVPKLRPGDTLYLLGGTYEAGFAVTVKGEPGNPVRILGRGREEVILRGPWDLGASVGVELERLIFEDKVSSAKGRALVFKHCLFAGESGGLEVNETDGLQVEHCWFADTRLAIQEGGGVLLRGNLFSSESGAPVLVGGKVDFLFADYNGYPETEPIWEMDGRSLGLSEVQALEHEIHSRQIGVGQSDLPGDSRLTRMESLRGWGPFSRSYGPFAEREEAALALAGPFIHRVNATSVDVEWWTSMPAPMELHWSTAEGDEQSVMLPKAFQFGGYSLTGLQPGTEYTLRVGILEADDPMQEEIAFRTLEADPEPTTYFVSAGGSDSADGKSVGKALRTISKASALAGPGDTIVVGAGEYPETVWVRSTGIPDRPVTFRSATGEKVSIGTFRMEGKHHIAIDGFYTNAQIELVGSSHVAITRCFSTGPLVQSVNSEDVLVKNCVSTSGYPFHGVSVINSPRFRLENSVVVNPAIYGAKVFNQSDQPVYLKNNIFTDNYPFKAPIQYFEVARAESLQVEDNCFYLRTPDEEMRLPKRNLFLFYDDEAYEPTARGSGLEPAASQPSKIKELTRMCLEDFHDQFGETGSFQADPEFRGAAGLEFPEGGRYTKDSNRGNRANIGYRVLASDFLARDSDFDDLFATNPELVEKGIGLIPADFADFHFNQPGPSSE